MGSLTPLRCEVFILFIGFLFLCVNQFRRINRGEFWHLRSGHPSCESFSCSQSVVCWFLGCGDPTGEARKSAASSGSRSASKLWSLSSALGSPALADTAVAAAVAAEARLASINARVIGSVGSSSVEHPGSATRVGSENRATRSSSSGSTKALNRTACNVCVRSIASPSALPVAAHICSDSGLPGYELKLGCKPGSVAPAPGQCVAQEGSITARSSPFGMRRVSNPSTALPHPRCDVHARRATGCRATAAAHARGACDAKRGSSVG